MQLPALLPTFLLFLTTTLTIASPTPHPQAPPCELEKQALRTYGPISIRVSNPAYPAIHNAELGFYDGEFDRDHHLYLIGFNNGPGSIYIPRFDLEDGNLLAYDPPSGKSSELVISNQTPIEGTTKLFFTQRLGNYHAIYDVFAGCELGPGEYELRLMEGGDENGGPPPYGGTMCVKPAHNGKRELKHVLAGSGRDLGDCIPVRLMATVIAG